MVLRFFSAPFWKLRQSLLHIVDSEDMKTFLNGYLAIQSTDLHFY